LEEQKRKKQLNFDLATQKSRRIQKQQKQARNKKFQNTKSDTTCEQDIPFRQSKTLLIDIETSPQLSWVWRNYQTDVIATKTEYYILSFAYKWLGESKKTKVVALPDFVDRYRENKEDDSELVKTLLGLLDECDFCVGHNLDRFDIRKTNARAIIAGLKPPSPYRTIDTLKIARKYFGFASNKLSDLGVVLGLGKKEKRSGMDTWFGCMNGDRKSWDEMTRYNLQDVSLLEKVYLRLRPWHGMHPNTDFHFRNVCPVCSSDKVHRRGFKHNKKSLVQQYQCQNTDCRHWFVGKQTIGVVE
jgi:DNA polymerase elongation subunit (family B)